MSAEILNLTDGILTARITGKLTQAELAALQVAAADLIRKHGKIRFLVLAEDFHGWEKGGDWGDVSFQVENDEHIVKMAMVGDKQWEDLALLFTAQGLRKFPIQYFLPTELLQARAWLKQG